MNEYMIDAYLSSWVWIILTLLYVQIITKLNQVKIANHNTIESTIRTFLKPTLWLTAIFALFWFFLLWRLGCLFQHYDAFGAGAIGLIVIFAILGIGMMWVYLLLIFIIKFTGAKPND